MLSDERLQGRDLWAVQILSVNFERIAYIDETDYVSLDNLNSMALSLTPLLMPISMSAANEFEDLSWMTSPKKLALDYHAMTELFDLSPVINEKGYITRSDIEQLLNDEQLKDHQRALRILSANFERIAYIDETDYVSLINLKLMAASHEPLLVPESTTLSSNLEYDSQGWISNPEKLALEYQAMTGLFDLSPAINEKGRIARSDIDQMLNDEQLKDHQRALQFLSANFDRITFIDETDYVSLGNLNSMALSLTPLLIPAVLRTAEEYDTLAVIKSPDILAAEYQEMEELFGLSSASNEKGRLTRSDIEKMINDEKLEDHQLRALHILSANFERMTFVDETDYVSLVVLKAMATVPVPLLIPVSTADFTRKTISGAVKARENLIFPSGVESIDPYNILQGGIGDCCLIAAISSYARTEKGRQAIYKMVQPLNSGSVKVILPGASASQYIEATGEPGLFMFQKASHNTPYSGRWASYIELAAAKIRSSIPGEREKAIKRAKRKLFNDDYDALEGISARAAIRLLTNRGVSRVFLQELPITELRQKMIEFEEQEESIATIEGLGLQINSNSSQPVSHIELPEEYKVMLRDHCYSILGFDSVTQMVTIRDPNGVSEPSDTDGSALDGNKDGVFEISISEMTLYFGAITISL